MNKRMKALLLALTMMCSVLLFAACNTQGGEETNPVETTPTGTEEAPSGYQVKVVDAFGAPVTEGVIVRFMQGGKQVTMQVVDENGVVTRDLEEGEYTVELQFTGSDAYYYDQSDLALNADKTSLEIVLYSAVRCDARTLYAPSLLTGESKEHEVYSVGVGGTYVELIPGERNYFLFTPTEAGTYEIAVQGTDAALGYYGAPHFVQQYSVEEPVNNVLTVSVKASMIGTGETGTTVMVLGVDAQEENTCVITIKRVGDPQWDVSDEPWHVYATTTTPSAFTLPVGSALGEFDLTASTDSYNLVYNEADGFYHLNSADGPLVLVRLTKPSQYMDDFKTVADKSHICSYFYDESGNFLRKESYNDCLLEYIACADEATGTYPLTEDLKYIIQQRGEYYGWWNVESNGYIFINSFDGSPIVGINTEIAWLFACCYVKQ